MTDKIDVIKIDVIGFVQQGFIAGGFIYMSVGGVMPSMHDQGNSLSSTLAQLVPMILGMGIAVVISLSE